MLSREVNNAAYAKALASSSRILPFITTAHMPSAANAIYWPEIYTNQLIVIDNAKDSYSDTPAPKRFSTVSPLDPQFFAAGAARTAWQGIVDRARGVYRDDLTFGYAPYLRGNWSDRMAAIDKDLVAMEAFQSTAAQKPVPAAPSRPSLAVQHKPVTTFRPGEPVVIEARAEKPLLLHYRHVDQSEPWERVEMKDKATIPAAYTKSEYPLQYAI